MALSRPALRALLDNLVRSDADLNRLCSDYFPEASRRFTDGMDRVHKQNILLDYADPAQLAERLRLLEQPTRAASPAEGGALRVLFLAANPTSTSPLALEREARRIEERLRARRPGPVPIALKVEWAARRSDLQRLLREERPHVLHFSGHGSARAQLLFEDDQGNIAPVEARTLAKMLGLFKPRLQLVVLNACDTRSVADALVKHIPFAVAMRQAISDEAATIFASAFYQALSFDETIQRAFESACIDLELEQIPEQRTPILRVQPGVDANTRTIEI